MKNFFDKFLYCPYPDYATRVMLWRHFIEECVRKALNSLQNETNDNSIGAALTNEQILQEEELMLDMIEKISATVDVSSLAYISEGYSAGAIARTVRTIVTQRRVQMRKQRPLTSGDFVDTLSTQDVTYQDDRAAYVSFLKVVSGLDDRRKKIDGMLSGADAAAAAGKKK
jgi:SpoVK/Ycf46/Vps4 family AAA+-type ATPase